MTRRLFIFLFLLIAAAVSAMAYDSSKGTDYHFDGGYLSATPTTSGSSYNKTLHFFICDHQGNIRLVVDGSDNIKQTNEYFPYGGPWGGSNDQGFQPFKYNGKELDRVHGLDWYDYGARRYDPAFCMFTQIDPLCEDTPHLNPYVYCAGNPVRYVDPDGKSFWSKFIKTTVKVGKRLTTNGVKALGETATYATAVADIVDDVNKLTDSEASTGDRILAGVSLASEALPLSINDVKDVGKVIKRSVHGNSKMSTRAQHAYDIVDKENTKIIKTGVSGGGKRVSDGKSQRAESQVRKWNREIGRDKFESVITHEIPKGSGAREKILKYEKKRANELRRQGHLDDKHYHINP